MSQEFARRTVASDVIWEGFGLHSGTPVKVTLRSGERGIWFLHGNTCLQAIPENVSSTHRCTQLGTISTIEHLMSALAGLEITDAEIELTAPELPALDGSAIDFVQSIVEAGILEIGKFKVSGPFARIYTKDGSAKVAVANGVGRWHYHFSSPGRWPEVQEFGEELNLESYVKEIAPARTWGFEEEVDAILAVGMAKGLDWNSALILGKEGYKNEARFSDEPARHKLLDLIGDLALSGVPARLLNVVGSRSGHKLNVESAKRLRDAVTFEAL